MSKKKKSSGLGDLPSGMVMQLRAQPEAMDTFNQMDAKQKFQMAQYIQSCETGTDAQERMASVIEKLRNQQKDF